MTDVRQLAYEAEREEWRQLHGLPGRKSGFGGRGEGHRGEAQDGRLRSLMGLSANAEQSENIGLPEPANSQTMCVAPSSGAAR